jgi:hypothetical protein
MGKYSERIKMARPGEPEAVRTTIVGGQPPGSGRRVGDVPRGVEVLVKKAAVDPAFKKMLLEKRAGAAEAIALKLEPAEAAMLNAVPEAQLRAIVANTKVSPGLRPAFLGYAAGVMLAALGTTAYAEDPNEWEMRTTGIDPEIPPKTETAATAETNEAADYGIVSGAVSDEKARGLSNVEITIKGTGLTTLTDKEGYYVFPSVPEGLYEIEASHETLGVLLKTGVKVIAGLRSNVSFIFGELSDSRERFDRYEKSVITGIRPDLPDKEGE